MANEDLARISVNLKINGTIRRKKTGRYPYYLYSDIYGSQFFNTREGQEYLIGEMEDLNDGEEGQGKVTKPERVKNKGGDDNGWL